MITLQEATHGLRSPMHTMWPVLIACQMSVTASVSTTSGHAMGDKHSQHGSVGQGVAVNRCCAANYAATQPDVPSTLHTLSIGLLGTIL